MAKPSTLDRRQLVTLLAAGLALPAAVFAKDSSLPVPVSLPQAAQSAAAKGEPLVLLISLPGCPFCELVRRSYLIPAAQEAGAQVWQLNITDRRTPLTAFDGQTTNAKAQAHAWQSTFTPTVLFLGPQGQTLAERLVGIAVPDFYGAYLDDRLATARQALASNR